MLLGSILRGFLGFTDTENGRTQWLALYSHKNEWCARAAARVCGKQYPNTRLAPPTAGLVMEKLEGIEPSWAFLVDCKAVPDLEASYCVTRFAARECSTLMVDS